MQRAKLFEFSPRRIVFSHHHLRPIPLSAPLADLNCQIMRTSNQLATEGCMPSEIGLKLGRDAGDFDDNALRINARTLLFYLRKIFLEDPVALMRTAYPSMLTRIRLSKHFEIIFDNPASIPTSEMNMLSLQTFRLFCFLDDIQYVFLNVVNLEEVQKSWVLEPWQMLRNVEKGIAVALGPSYNPRDEAEAYFMMGKVMQRMDVCSPLPRMWFALCNYVECRESSEKLFERAWEAVHKEDLELFKSTRAAIISEAGQLPLLSQKYIFEHDPK